MDKAIRELEYMIRTTERNIQSAMDKIDILKQSIQDMYDQQIKETEKADQLKQVLAMIQPKGEKNHE